jgi:putative ABC transport system ATP-binding protein
VNEGMQPPIIELRGVTKVYGSGHAAVHALAGVDLTIAQGEFVAIMGPSGSGKSTAMNLIGCLDTPTSGDYLFKGVSLGTLSRDQRTLLRRHFLGFVFQGFNLLARTTAVENVELPLIYRGMAQNERRRLAMRALERVGLEGREHHTSAELSGGQQQRVAIARAIVTDPTLIVADEPTGDLDKDSAGEILTLLERLNKEFKKSIVMVTHDPRAAEKAHTVRHLDKGELESVNHNK